jgi:nickel-dependent lactate racemase
MAVELAYGEGHLTIDLPGTVDVIEPHDPPEINDPLAQLVRALQQPIEAPPLKQLTQGKESVVIVISDSTRPAPNQLMLEAVLNQLGPQAEASVQVLVATGLHRATREDELDRMLGSDLRKRLRIIDHDARDPACLREIGATSSGRPVIINQRYLDADVRITLGLIEPHFFAGFSGGPKLVMPGIAGEKSILKNHDFSMISHPNARWGVLDGNPIHQEQREAALLAGCDFSLNVSITANGSISGIFAGDLEASHKLGCQAVLKAAMQPVEKPYDVVVTTNGGHPLDLNLYQAVKGMDAAAQIVKPGGHIVMAAECRDGIGHGDFAHILKENSSAAAMVQTIASSTHVRSDQWQNQILGRVLSRATIHLYAGGLSENEVRSSHCIPCKNIAARIKELAGPTGRTCVLPRGPFTIPYLES